MKKGNTIKYAKYGITAIAMLASVTIVKAFQVPLPSQTIHQPIVTIGDQIKPGNISIGGPGSSPLIEKLTINNILDTREIYVETNAIFNRFINAPTSTTGVSILGLGNYSGDTKIGDTETTKRSDLYLRGNILTTNQGSLIVGSLPNAQGFISNSEVCANAKGKLVMCNQPLEATIWASWKTIDAFGFADYGTHEEAGIKFEWYSSSIDSGTTVACTSFGDSDTWEEEYAFIPNEGETSLIADMVEEVNPGDHAMIAIECVDESGNGSVIAKEYIEVIEPTIDESFGREIANQECKFIVNADISGISKQNIMDYQNINWTLVVDGIQYSDETQGDIKGKFTVNRTNYSSPTIGTLEVNISRYNPTIDDIINVTVTKNITIPSVESFPSC